MKEVKAAAALLAVFGMLALFYAGGWWLLTRHEHAVEALGTLFVKLGICATVFGGWGYYLGLRDGRKSGK